jgi:hypothetical protein
MKNGYKFLVATIELYQSTPIISKLYAYK